MNTQHRESPSHDPDGYLDVHSVWDTIQGEGPFAGSPSVFVRLAGCNLECPLCDTDYTSKRQRFSPLDLLNEVRYIRLPRPRWTQQVKVPSENSLLVLTGGEPFRQNLLPFVAVAVNAGYRVQVETNGTFLDTAFFASGVPCSIVCSPKAAVIADLWPHIHAVKYVVHKDQFDPTDGMPTHALGNRCGVARPPKSFNGIVYIQPLDEDDPIKNKEHLENAISICREFGYRLCIQVHKVIGVP